MGNDINYDSIDVPSDENPADMTYAERRADILSRIRAAGSPRLVNGAELADKYDCSRQNISNDIDVLGEYVSDNLGDRQEFVTDAVFQKAISELLDDEEWRDAARTVKEWNTWLHDRHEIADLADRVEVLAEHQERAKYR